ncbi:uncharacterized protein LOC110346901 isoform X2 [Heterocephalus glaber]|uniref:Uncharacterized protein LOC110346901 isoform X2 n=1 Tax=Heterocephalus glaber TaxID=10181 RepID=A0AAX6S568_HETGA|nr:uncharacterized protein LOC110346901 isoform X2 [Heterocephalus glaber]
MDWCPFCVQASAFLSFTLAVTPSWEEAGPSFCFSADSWEPAVAQDQGLRPPMVTFLTRLTVAEGCCSLACSWRFLVAMPTIDVTTTGCEVDSLRPRHMEFRIQPVSRCRSFAFCHLLCISSPHCRGSHIALIGDSILTSRMKTGAHAPGPHPGACGKGGTHVYLAGKNC